VLILDEPTAALDLSTEAHIAEALRATLPEATIIVITHKPALARRADMVVTLEQGRCRVSQPSSAEHALA
jgi:ATP-binding cassette subfamily B protein